MEEKKVITHIFLTAGKKLENAAFAEAIWKILRVENPKIWSLCHGLHLVYSDVSGTEA